MIYNIDTIEKIKSFSPSDILDLIVECRNIDLEIFNRCLNGDLTEILTESDFIIHEVKSGTIEFIIQKIKELAKKAIQKIKQFFYKMLTKIKSILKKDKEFYNKYRKTFENKAVGLKISDVVKDSNLGFITGDPIGKFQKLLDNEIIDNASMNSLKSKTGNVKDIEELKSTVSDIVEQEKFRISDNKKNLDKIIAPCFFDKYAKATLDVSGVTNVSSVMDDSSKFIKSIEDVSKRAINSIEVSQKLALAMTKGTSIVNSVIDGETRIGIMAKGSYDIFSVDLDLMSNSLFLMSKYAMMYVDQCRGIFTYVVKNKEIKQK